tara:strand:+ start:107 stop:553 length:447 start_codon:yes stop_codon:yes gene_type:complete
MPGNTLLFSEVLDKVHKAKTKDQKVKILKEHNTPALRSVLKSSFDPNIKWVLPEGEVPYRKNDAPIGTEHTTLATESSKLWHFIKGGDGQTPQWKKEQMFVQMLEGLHQTEADLLINAKDKKLHQVYKGLSTNVVMEAFGWNEEFKLP